MNNDQAVPPVAQAESSEHDRELVDAALSEASTHNDTPSEASSANIVPPTTTTSPTFTPVVGVENTYSPDGSITPQAEKDTTATAPIAKTSVTNTVVPEIPVRDNTSVVPESTMSAPISEPVEEAQANDPIAQAQTMNTYSLEQPPLPTKQPSPPVMQVPAQPEGLVARFLHIFKK